MEEIHLSASLSRIGERALFSPFPKISSIYLESTVPPYLHSDAFYQNANPKPTLYVPFGCKELYEAANWKYYTTIVEMEESSVSPIINFVDASVKALCVTNWDTDGDGELSEAEAAAVIDLGTAFCWNSRITSFDELKYFTGLRCINSQAFMGCTSLASVTIPDGVASIEHAAFHSCKNLSTITIPNGVIVIGDEAFSQCSGLTSVLIPNSVTTIDYLAFYDCSGLTSIDIPNSVTSIGETAFERCSALTSVNISSNVSFIGDGAFSMCVNLANISVDAMNQYYDSRNNCNAIIDTRTSTLIVGCKNSVIPEGVTSIGNLAFFYCRGLTSIDIPNSVTSIGSSSFNECRGLTSITIPDSMISIGENAFLNCTGLAVINMSDNLEYIGKDAFRETAWYENQADGLIYAGKVAYRYKGTMPDNTAISLKEGTLGIAGAAFLFCAGLISITIPSSVTNIGNEAFEYCKNLVSVSIPNSVITIGDRAFRSCI